MPNGGSDCCGTCWFNSKNEGKPGYHGSKIEGIVICTIRDLEIPDPFWTYCANHPHHNSERIELPMGPVYINDNYPYSRKVWINPPDNESIRLKLLDLLNCITGEVQFKYPSQTDLEEEVIRQLTLLKEYRAVEGLRKVINLDVDLSQNLDNFIIRNKLVIVGQAIEALLQISDGNCIDEVKHFINKGIEEFDTINYNEENDKFAVIRYHLVRGLKYSNSKLAKDLLTKALEDPHSDVKAVAREIFNNMV